MTLTPFTFRPSVAADIPAWCRLVPHEMPLDPRIAARLPALWTSLLQEEAIEARTIVSNAGDHERVEAFGASVFLPSGAFADLIGSPPRRVAESIYRALLNGDKAILSAREIAKANSNSGVDVCVMHFCERPVDLNDPIGQQLLAMGHAAFRDAHLGYNVRALVHQNFRPSHRAFLLAGGMALFHDFAAPADVGRDTAESSVIVGMTRDQAMAQPAGSPISFLFLSQRPRFYFAPSERRVLRAALTGRSDGEIAALIGVSHDAVKAAWKVVFRRVAEYAGEDASHGRRRLLEYLRQHPEELRPYQRPAGR